MTTETNSAAVSRAGLVFTLFDANGNGVIEADDFELLGQRVLAVSEGADEAAKDALLDSLRGWWTTLVTELDTDGDGQVDPEEFNAIVLAPERFGDALDAFAVALPALGDPDGDGLVERPLFVALMTAIGFAVPNIQALFDAFGPDAEDRVTTDVWAQGIRDYYAPDKVGIAGDALVGGAAA
ncbi:EF-hand domain-containing protein [Streptomyces avicenniae]|uniref:EF-hand domain-containing protein n=1 Tax=Streptomyces avicenniae TaxID=500153 RepID=UPI00069A5B4F|nr:EF-hand domain-containing protein [Streptomyces avicenniae]